MSEEKEIHHGLQSKENDLISWIENSLKVTESRFEEYLTADRVDVLKNILSLMHSTDHSVSFETNIHEKIHEILGNKIKDLEAMITYFDKIQEQIRTRNFFTIYQCYMVNLEETNKEIKEICKNYLQGFLQIIQILMDFLIHENALHFLSLKRFEGPNVVITRHLKKVIDILNISLSFLNKNSPTESAYFDMLKEYNDELFYIISRIRVFGYVIRAYIKFILIKKNPKYSISMDDYDYVLNDCNKVLNILERDFRLSNVQHGEDAAETRDNFEKNAKWLYFASIATNIMKGYVYYEIRNNARSLDAFCHAIRFYDKIRSLLVDSATQKTPFDIAKAKLIMGKIFVDKGLFLDSLYWYLDSLHDFLYVFDNIASIRTMQHGILEKSRLLLIGKHNDIIDKNIVCELLNAIAVNDLIEIEKEDNAAEWVKGYISDILSRAGYVFYILLSNVEGVQTSIKTWYDVALKLFPNNSLAVQNLSLLPDSIGDRSLGQALSSILVEPSRKLNLLALFELNQMVIRDKGEKQLERDIFRSLLTNLENIITVPQRFNKQLILEKKIGKGQHKDVNKLLCLRRWNSFTPVIPRPVDFSRGFGGIHSYNSNKCPGGGYFFIWNNKGIAIDPGFDFIRNLYSAGYSISDINAIILTHSHIDHMGDFFSLLTLIYERKDLLEQLYGEDSEEFKEEFNKIDLFLNIGSMNSFLPWFASQTKDIIRHIHALPRSSKEEDPHNFILDVSQEYNIKIEVTKAVHKEISTENWAIGLKFHLPVGADNEQIVIGITSDTISNAHIIQQYSECHLLAGHLGDINFKEISLFADIYFKENDAQYLVRGYDKEVTYLKELAVSLGVTAPELKELTDPVDIVKLILKRDENYQLKNHLGFRGIYKLAENLVRNNGKFQKLFIFTEFPEYFGSFRKRIAGHFNDHFCERGKTFFTGDIGLQVLIDQKAINPDHIFRIQCNKCARDNDVPLSDTFHKTEDIQETCVKASDESIVYYCHRHKIRPDKHFINRLTQ